MHAAFALVALAVTSVHAIIEPTSPGPGDSFKVGEKCSFAWDPDTDSPDTWKVTNVQLMTGRNLEMIHLDTVAQIDGTQRGTYEFDCPDVTPYSPIYFYQFSTPDEPGLHTWATRFAITSSTGQTVPPAQAAQPENTDVPPIAWGIGKLVDPSKARPPPAYLAAGGNPPPSAPSGSLPGASAPSSPSGSTPPSAPSAPSTPSTPSTPNNSPSKPPTQSGLTGNALQASVSGSGAPSKSSGSPQDNSAASLSVLGKSGVVMSMIAGVFVLFL